VVFGLIASTVLAHGSLIKAIAWCLGLLFGIIADVNSGVLRFTFDVPELSDGIGFVIVRWACSHAEIMPTGAGRGARDLHQEGHNSGRPSRIQGLWGAVLRGTALGSMLASCRGGRCSFLRPYTVEKKVSRHPERLARGDPGRGRPSRRTSRAQTFFIRCSRSASGNAVMALMIGRS